MKAASLRPITITMKGTMESAKSAGRATRWDQEQAAPRSVLRVFLRSAKAANARRQAREGLESRGRRSESVLRVFLRSPPSKLRRCLGGVLIAMALQASDVTRDAFSHKAHAPLKLKCALCHAGAAKEERAGFPTVAQCRTCHTDMGDRTIPSERKYRVPDFVFFSHRDHAAASLECAGCHGEVYQTADMKPARPALMYACVNCHKEHKASVACNTCHELGQ